VIPAAPLARKTRRRDRRARRPSCSAQRARRPGNSFRPRLVIRPVVGKPRQRMLEFRRREIAAIADGVEPLAIVEDQRGHARQRKFPGASPYATTAISSCSVIFMRLCMRVKTREWRGYQGTFPGRARRRSGKRADSWYRGSQPWAWGNPCSGSGPLRCYEHRGGPLVCQAQILYYANDETVN
jgi:hypothetical protein